MSISICPFCCVAYDEDFNVEHPAECADNPANKPVESEADDMDDDSSEQIEHDQDLAQQYENETFAHYSGDYT